MTDNKSQSRTRWWHNTAISEPPDNDDNVVRMRSDWRDLERDIIDATNAVVHWEAEAAKVEAGYRQSVERLRLARSRFAERCKEMGARIEFISHPPEMVSDDDQA